MGPCWGEGEDAGVGRQWGESWGGGRDPPNVFFFSSLKVSLAAQAAWAGRPTRDAVSSVSGTVGGGLGLGSPAQCRAPGGGTAGRGQREVAVLAPTPPLSRSQGSVAVQSTLVFGHSEDSVTSDSAEKKLRSQLDSNGYIMDLQLADIQSEWGARAPGVL